MWTMQNEILFDNIYIGHSVKDAEALQKETFDIKNAIEKQEEESSKPKTPERPKSPNDLVFMDDPVLYVREKVELFLTIAQRSPLEAAKFVPEVAAGMAAIAVTIVALLASAAGLGAAKAPSKEEIKAKAQAASQKAKEIKDQVVDKTIEVKNAAVDQATTSAEMAQEEIKKRTTRSTAQQ